jgi:hypothetical protein
MQDRCKLLGVYTVARRPEEWKMFLQGRDGMREGRSGSGAISKAKRKAWRDTGKTGATVVKIVLAEEDRPNRQEDGTMEIKKILVTASLGGLLSVEAPGMLLGQQPKAQSGKPSQPGQVTAGESTNSSDKPIGWIGLHGQNKGDGAVVIVVNPDGPGAKAGIQVGDIILALDGRLLKGKDLETVVAALKPGTQISVNFARGSSPHEVSLIVGSQN